MLPHHLKTLEFEKVLALLVQRCTFAVGEELAAGLGPSTDAGEIRRAQDATEEARRLLEVRPNTGVRDARDIRAHIRRAAVGGSLTPADLLEVAATIGAGRAARNLLLRREVGTPTLAHIAQRIPDLDALEAAIRVAIDDEGQVLDSASEQLRQIRMALRNAYDRLMRRLNDLLSSSTFREALQEPIITMRSGRYVVPVKADFRGRIRGIVHDQSASGATLFVEPLPVIDLANTWRQHGIEEEREVERVLAELSGRVHTAQFGLADTVDALARLDLVFASGKLALEMRAVRPVLSTFDAPGEGREVIRLVGARHPLLRGDVVPIDVHLGADFDILLVTGPNTGGKTVALKTVGLLALMAQAGLQIPAEEGSSLTIFSGVYADIGDEQSIEQSLSTFSSHVRRIIEILERADRRSLVLLDEVGAGTDPQEGSALSQALLQHLARLRASTIATTHSSELKSFAFSTPRVENASVEFDVETLRPTYRLTIGLPGRSNALAIAAHLGMPLDIIADARQRLRPDERRVEDLLGQIQEQLGRARGERAEAARLRLEAERATRQLRSESQAVERERAGIIKKAEEERAATIAELHREADALRRELRGLKAERQRLAAIEERIPALRNVGGEAALQGAEGAEGPFQAGDLVQVRSLGSVGTVREVMSSGIVEVDVGGMRVRVATDQLEPAQAAAERPTPRQQAVAAGYLAPAREPSRFEAEGWNPVESQLDLRGLTTEEARYRVDRYLNDAYMEGMGTVRIVHGKGTGAVRQAVRDLLADHPLVRSHQTADPQEGGDGATVVRLAS